MMMDRIEIHRLRCYGYHGCHPEENRLGQAFLVSLSLALDLRRAGVTDALEDTLDYGRAISLAREVVEGPPCRLIETVAARIIEQLFSAFPRLESAAVEITKVHPPLPVVSEGVSVRLERSRRAPE